MSLGHSPVIVLDGLVEVIDPAYATGSSVYTLTNKFSRSTITSNNFSVGSTLPVTTFLSNCNSSGSGDSFLTVTRNTSLETGSISFFTWFNLNNVPLDVGANNNWRALLTPGPGGSTSGSPLSIVVEETGAINFTTSTATNLQRFLSSNFAPFTVPLSGWQNIVYTYSSQTGIATCYLNNVLVRTGPMTTDTLGSNATTAGTNLSYTNYTNNGYRIYCGATINTANPNGNGPVPGLLGVTYIYNRALTAAEVSQNFNAMRGRYGI